LETGHIELVSETKHRSQVVTVTYRVKSLNPDGTVDAPKPSHLRVVPEPMPADPEPPYDGPEPEYNFDNEHDHEREDET
jgi:hypothetical protein